MAREIPFAPYMADAPYLFTSYAHKDSERVFAVISRLHSRRYRIWYDEGIEIGADWPQVVAEKLQHSATVLIFLSENALQSQNCRREIHFAVSQKKDMIVVLLDDCALPADVAMQLSVVPQLRFTDAAQTAAEIAEQLDDALLGDGVTGYAAAGGKHKRARNVWLVVAIVMAAALLGAVAYIVAGMNGKLSGAGIVKETIETGETAESGPVTVTRFQDAISMELLLKSLGTEYVHICGNCIVSDAAAITRTSEGWAIGGEAVERGPIAKLDYFAGQSIRQLSLVNESLRKTEGLETLKELSYLDLSDNPLTDLSGLAGLDALETVKLLGLPADADLSPLAALPALRTVYVSYDMVKAIGPLVDAGVDVIVRR
jgi:hypothetical protein